MDIAQLLEFTLWVGEGRARHKMRRGSFQCKDKIAERIPLRVKEKSAGEIVYADASGEALLRVKMSGGNPLALRFEPAPGRAFNRLWIRLPAEGDEHVYGCGETFAKLDLRGERVPVWVQEHQRLPEIIGKVLSENLFGRRPRKAPDYRRECSYYAQPTFFSSRKYFMHAESNAYAAFDFTRREYHELVFHEVPVIYLGTAESFEGLCEMRAILVGTQPPLPDWAYDGAVLGIQGGTEVVERKIEAAKAAGMPVCGVWCQDWQGARITAVGSQLMWNWEWDAGRYPGLDEAIPRWRAQGVRFMGYINPFLAIEKELYAYASPRGYCVKDRRGKDYLVKSTTFSSAMVDFTNPEAYEWIKGVIKTNMIGLGLGGWMADFGEYLPTDCVLHEGDPAILHNQWPAIWARINREAIEECGKLGEVFFFTRAGYTGTVRYSTLMWNGDQYTDWSRKGGMPEALPAALSLGVSGCGLSHSDAGGFSTFIHVKRTPELMARWAEFCAFTPLMRSHEGIRPGNNAQFDANGELLGQYTKMARVHRGLKAYLQAAERENTQRGVPVMRPLFFYYDGERDMTECYEYLLGRDVLAAPVLLPGVDTWEVYLPEDGWVHLWTGEEYTGGVHCIPAPVGEPPVFVRKESMSYNELMELGEII